MTYLLLFLCVTATVAQLPAEMKLPDRAAIVQHKMKSWEVWQIPLNPPMGRSNVDIRRKAPDTVLVEKKQFDGQGWLTYSAERNDAGVLVENFYKVESDKKGEHIKIFEIKDSEKVLHRELTYEENRLVEEVFMLEDGVRKAKEINWYLPNKGTSNYRIDTSYYDDCGGGGEWGICRLVTVTADSIKRKKVNVVHPPVNGPENGKLQTTIYRWEQNAKKQLTQMEVSKAGSQGQSFVSKETWQRDTNGFVTRHRQLDENDGILKEYNYQNDTLGLPLVCYFAVPGKKGVMEFTANYQVGETENVLEIRKKMPQLNWKEYQRFHPAGYLLEWRRDSSPKERYHYRVHYQYYKKD